MYGEYIPYEDGSHVYVLNSKYREGNAAPAIKDIRNDEKKESSYVTMQMYMVDEKRAAFEDGIRTIVARMFRKGKSVEDIAEDTETSIKEVQDILKAEGLLD